MAQRLAVDPALGLAAAEVVERRRRFGENRLRRARRRSAAEILGAQLKSLVVVLLGAASLVSFAFGEWIEGIAIAVVLLINTALGFVAELRAARSMEALRRLGSVEARVRRDGRESLVPAQDLVPGDLVLLDEGDVVTADLRLIEANAVEVDESALTGESVPVLKDAAAVPPETVLAERSSMAFKGTSVTRGSAVGLVTAVGMESELGRVASLVAAAEASVTPLEQRLEALGRRLIWGTMVIAALTTALGVAGGRDLFLMIETGLALAVAAIPEGLPIVATIALARGMWRMAARQALINRLAAVETLGATTLILTDKTGTLTENRMAVRRLELAEHSVKVGTELFPTVTFEAEGKPLAATPGSALRALLEAGVLCNNAALQLEDGEVQGTLGDPMEAALLLAGMRAGIDREVLLAERPEEREIAFDRATRMMATLHRHPGGGFEVAVKGAPEAVLAACSRQLGDGGVEKPLEETLRRRWQQRQEELARSGLRLLALARGCLEQIDDDPYRELTLLGLVGFADPPRREVSTALEACRRAGIRVVMVTGDHAVTARHVAEALGLAPAGRVEVIEGGGLEPLSAMNGERREELRRSTVFARVDPAQKLDLIRLHQEAGEVVAMTGDGVNDAPALRQADIGIAMGRRGTAVAKEAADMVLADDAFASIVAAVEQGRIIFGNIRKFVLYLLSCNVSEIFLVAGATALQVPLPILPLQILFLNLVTDVFPALALAFGEGEKLAMERPPRDPAEPLLARRHWLAIVGYGLLITASVLGALLVSRRALSFEVERAVTVSFLCLALSQLWHVFNLRQRGSRLLRNEITANPWVWGALALCLALLGAAVYLPGLSDVLGAQRPGLNGWGVAFGFSLVPLVVGQALRARKPR